ncbi:hypothetical protein H1R20_g8616, partial [Candolleomyces eurysporus]
MNTEPGSSSSSTNTISYKVIGTPFSTFTRTITLGLHYKGIPFEQISTTPHTEVARDAHPARLSSGIWTEYPPEPSLHFKPSAPDGQLEEKMWEVVSLIASFGFPTIEVGVIKPHLKALADGTPERTILQRNYDGHSKITEFLSIIDQRTVPNAKYLFGDQLTWADFYLYPLLADLRALPEWILTVEHRFMKWAETMDELDAVKKTFAGTLADERS